MSDNTTPRNRQVATILAFAGIVIPVAGFHKFYLGQPLWGIVYLLLSWTPIPHIASAIDAIWYLTQDSSRFDSNFNSTSSLLSAATISTHPMITIAESIRELDKLREDGLISEYEFEQKRRQWLDRV
ncbi:MAG: NINE protein [Chamaesiphon sp.]|nr:NINE protein [Chamaesiphon sp.]